MYILKKHLQANDHYPLKIHDDIYARLRFTEKTFYTKYNFFHWFGDLLDWLIQKK